MDEKQKVLHENLIGGTVGALLGSLLGGFCIIVLGQMGFIASISGFVMGICAIRGYEKLGGRLSKRGAVITGVLILVNTYLAHLMNLVIGVSSAADISLLDAFHYLGFLWKNNGINVGAYLGSLAMLYLFTLIGAVPAILKGLRDQQPFIFPKKFTSTAANDDVKEITIYYAQRDWLRQLKISLLAALSVPLCIIFGLLLLFSYGEYTNVLPLALVGSLLAVLILLFITIPAFKLLGGESILLVQDEDQLLWLISHCSLNTLVHYSYTINNSGIRSLCWEKLSPQEQERAKRSIARAIGDIRSGQLAPDHLLRRYVIPLTDAQLEQEDKWQWNIIYRIQNGYKKLSIPKVFQNLRPAYGCEQAQRPTPYRLHYFAIAVSLMLVFSCIGGSISSVASKVSPVDTPDAPMKLLEINGISYQVDGTFYEQDTDTYFDEECQCTFLFSADRNINDDDALTRLSQVIADNHRSSDFDTVRFDYIADDWRMLTAQDGATYRSNILTVYFKSGQVKHTAVLLTDDGTMFVIDASHDKQKNEELVRSKLQRILESVVVTPTEDTDDALVEAITTENYQSFFLPALDMGYTYLGIAYYKAPEEMFGKGVLLQACLPLDGKVLYEEDGQAVQATAHGLQIRSKTVYIDGNAETVVDKAYEDFLASGADINEQEVYDTQYYPEYDIAFKRVRYFINDGTEDRVTLFYANLSAREQYYFDAQITYLPEQMDEDTSALLTEIGNYFGLTMPLIFEIPSQDEVEQ